MPRVQLKTLKQYDYLTALDVRVSDVNYGGHVGNDQMIALLHQARLNYLKFMNWSELDCAGVSLIMSDLAIQYKAESYLGDTLNIEMAMGEPQKLGFRIFYRITHADNQKLIALAETGMVCFDYQTKKPQRVPDAILSICQKED